MCYGCRMTCDDCKPKFIICSHCGWRGFLIFDMCPKCKAVYTQKEKERAEEEWLKKKTAR